MKNMLPLIFAALMSHSVSAATINVTSSTTLGVTTFNFDNTGHFGTGTDATLSCAAGACAVLGLADLSNSGEHTELSFLESLISQDLGDVTVTKFTPGSEGFQVTEKFFMLKFGSAISVWLQNLLFDTPIEVDFTTGRGAGLSHVSTFDSVSEVPVPGTMGLLGLGLLGLGLVRRRITV